MVHAPPKSALHNEATPCRATGFRAKMCHTASRHCLSLSPDACARTTVHLQACKATCPFTTKESNGTETCAQVLRHERKHLVVEVSGNSRVRSQRHYDIFLHGAFWTFCLALPHHQSIVITPALAVRIATNDSDLIAQTAGSVATIRTCILGRTGLRHAIARAHLDVAVVMHMFKGRSH